MRDLLQHLVAKHRTGGILVDTNILLLYFIGGWRLEMVPRFKRTAQFAMEDYKLLSLLLRKFSPVVTTPHVLSEVSNLSSQLGEPIKSECFRHFAQAIHLLDEKYLPSTEITREEGFARFGLTDSAIARVAAGRYLVLTDDLRLSQYLSTVGIDVINFNHVRTLGWR
jgi:rRNA-processing protein FCF1